ncbi:hypothetical protein WICPIJ_003854 [Wickerhamomyces pijperi]|uniref:Rad50/SbcC-type AAA domain-containing protein n=1 Tax=Wickerhamomyces pijperi TaxID=599730 RepID=A0A9P8Q6R0_WICPI|nr:hypothetical protein WICPIJ_003854 [Wickerhamomyces pijperi]
MTREDLDYNRQPGKRPRESDSDNEGDEDQNVDIEFMLTQPPQDEKKRELKFRKKIQKQEFKQSQVTQVDSSAESEEYAGHIKRVSLRNFMSHANFELEFGPRLNFIIGHNGSGKSAILTAICVCLGAKATETNRGSNLKSLIKEGTNSSTITVVLSNEGSDAFDQDKFGKEIIIERTIKRDNSPSPYVMKNQFGKKVSQKKADLEKMLDTFNIAVSNPMSFLSQDAARSFLTASSDEQKYNYFMKGTQMQEIIENFNNSNQELATMGLKLASIRTVVEGLKKKEEAAAALYEKISLADNITAEIRLYNGKFLWVQAENSIQNKATMQQKIIEYDDAKVKLESQMGTFKEQYDNIDGEILATHTEQNIIINDHEEAKAEYEEKKKIANAVIHNAEAARSELERKAHELAQVQKNLAELENDISIEVDRINRQQGGSREVLEAQHQQFLAKKQSLQEQEQSLTQELESFDENNRRELGQIQSRLSSVTDGISETESYIDQIRQSQRDSDPIHSYDSPYQNLVRMINAKQHLFRTPPIGPLGRYISIKPEHQDWAKYLDPVMGAGLNTFVVTNYEDLKILRKMGNECRCDGNFTARKPERFDYSHGLPDRRFLTVLDVLEFKNEEVKYALIDSHKIESSVLANSRDEGQGIIEAHTRNVGQTLVKFPGRDGGPDSVIKFSQNPNSGLRQDSVKASGGKRKITVQNMSAELPQQERLRADLLRDKAQLKKELDHLTNSLSQKKAGIQKQLNEIRRSMKKLDNDIYQIEKKLESENDSGKLDELNHQRSTFLENIQFLSTVSIPSLQRALEEEEAKKELVHNEYKEALAAVKRIQDSKRQLEEFVINKQQEKQILSQTIEKFHNTLKMIDIKKAKKLQAIDQESIEIEQQTKNAEKFCSKDEADKIKLNDPNKLHQQINKLKKKLSTASEKLAKSPETIVDEFRQAKQEYAQAMKEFTNISEARNTLKNSLTYRVNTFKSNKLNTFMESNYDFEKSLAFRGFSGKISFDDVHKKLTMTVRTKNDKESRHVDSLSGGEKSFSQISFLLATWKPMRSTIKGLDEFDVFMDQVNRKIGMRLMLSKLSQERKAQTIFITPQDIGQIADLDKNLVRIHRIKDPRANQH